MVTKEFYINKIHDPMDPRSPTKGYEDLEYKTFKQWKKSGYHVVKGQKSRKRSPTGEALFCSNQVEANDPGDHDWDFDDHDQFMAEYGHSRDWI